MDTQAHTGLDLDIETGTDSQDSVQTGTDSDAYNRKKKRRKTQGKQSKVENSNQSSFLAK